MTTQTKKVWARGNGPRKRKKKTFFLAILLVIMAAICGFWWMSHKNEGKLERAVKAELGQLDNKSNEEIQQELNRVVDESSMAISINGNPVFTDGRSEGTLQIENSPANHYAQLVVITRNDTGERIYSSGILYPNYHIQTDTLDVDLDAGDYECTATFTGYSFNEGDDIEDMLEVGMASAIITITILS